MLTKVIQVCFQCPALHNTHQSGPIDSGPRHCTRVEAIYTASKQDARSLLLYAGVKMGKFCVCPELCDPDNQQRQQQPEDVEPLEAALQRYMPHAVGELLEFATCMFTMTPDGHFIIDKHPRHEQVGQLEALEASCRCVGGSQTIIDCYMSAISASGQMFGLVAC